MAPVRTFACDFSVFGKAFTLHSLDLAGILVLVALIVIYLVTISKDAHEYAEMDPMPKR